MRSDLLVCVYFLGNKYLFFRFLYRIEQWGYIGGFIVFKSVCISNCVRLSFAVFAQSGRNLVGNVRNRNRRIYCCRNILYRYEKKILLCVNIDAY